LGHDLRLKFASERLPPQPLQHVLRDAHHMRVVALEAMRPIGGGGGEDGAGVGVEAEAGGAGAADLPFLLPLDVVGVPAHGAGWEKVEKRFDTLATKPDI